MAISIAVSVVVPAWNVAGLVPRCLDSLLAQTHRPLEIIVVDDGSTDGSGEVLRGYQERHPDLQVLSQPHRGLGPARNAGLNLALGEYVCVVDADDWVEPDYVADLLAIAKGADVDVVICGFWIHFWRRRVRFPFLPDVPRLTGPEAVSYTHLDVYKRQTLVRPTISELAPSTLPTAAPCETCVATATSWT